MGPLTLAVAICLVSTITIIQSTDAAINGSAKVRRVRSAGSTEPSSESETTGYKRSATIEVCQDADNSVSSVCLSGQAVGSYAAYIVTLRSNEERVWYMTACPGDPDFYVKNVGGDQWTVFYL